MSAAQSQAYWGPFIRPGLRCPWTGGWINGLQGVPGWQWHNKHVLKTKGFHAANFAVTGGTAGCHYDNLLWRQGRLYDKSCFSMYVYIPWNTHMDLRSLALLWLYHLGLVDSCGAFTGILKGYLTGSGAIMWWQSCCIFTSAGNIYIYIW